MSALAYLASSTLKKKRGFIMFDSRTKKYFGGEDPQEWADNNHPVNFHSLSSLSISAIDIENRLLISVYRLPCLLH
jgi:hypothetical protein